MDDKGIEKEENLSDIVVSDEDKSDKTKKFMFGATIIVVVVIIIFVIAASFSSESADDKMQNSINLDFLEDGDDPFFMDSPVDSIDQQSNEVENLQEDDIFSKESLLNESNSNSQENIYNSNIRPVTLSPIESETVSQTSSSTSLMSKENEAPVVQTITPEKIEPLETVKQVVTESGHMRELYIQTGTFFKYKPNKKFLKGLEDLGLSYSIDIYTKNSVEITRVLVGPFKTKSDANEALLSIREKVVKDAYILKTRLH